jgi:ribosome-associated protein
VILVKRLLSTKKTVLLCVNAALEKKARNIVILNVKKLSSIADYFIICSGGSDRQVQSIASAIEENLKKEKKPPLGIEGDRIGKWILMDYGDVVIHVFYEPVRDFYDLERLWADVPRMEVAEDLTEITSLRKGM